MTKQRTLSEAEQAARKKYGGLTAREFRAKNSKFNRPVTTSGSYDVEAIFDGNPVVQTAPFPNDAAAIARFERLSSNPNVLEVRVVQSKDGKRATIFSLKKGGQEFANSKTTTIYREPNGNTMLTMKTIKASPRLTDAFLANKLEAVKHKAEGGQAWWERSA